MGKPMPMFRPLIKKLPERGKNIMTLVIVGGMIVAFIVLSIYQRMPSAKKSVLPLGELTRRDVTSQEIMSLQKINPSFYASAEPGDVVVTYSDKVILYRPSQDRIILYRAIP
jgi:hypothetical protein